MVIFYNGTFETNELIKELESKLGNEDFDILMVHTSFNNLIPMYQGNVSELLDGLLDFSNKRNITFMMPGFMLGKKNMGAEEYYKSGKSFNVKKTPTTVGLINEIFRRKKGVYRSLHPTHSILAIGPKAEEIIKNHHLSDTTFGLDTPFGKMNSYRTKILGVGVYYFRNLTHVHVAEDILKEDFPYPVIRKYKEMDISLIDYHNEVNSYKLKVFTDDLSKRRDLTILKKHMRINYLTQWKYRGVPMFLADANKVTETLLEIARKGKSIYN